jgi:heat shock protein HslJ
MCPPGSLHDRIVKQWPYVRSYVMKDGHLFVSLMADGGIYEFEPARYPVLTGGKGNEVELMLRKAVASPAATEPLENTSWKLMTLGDAPVTVASGQREPHLIINSMTRRVGGSGGCNRLTGSYELSGDRLSLSPMAATLMARTEGMETEKSFLDASGNVVASFEARHME